MKGSRSSRTQREWGFLFLKNCRICCIVCKINNSFNLNARRLTVGLFLCL
nr:MAG TPA: hypothetical protein [Caudoviricetes sp.]